MTADAFAVDEPAGRDKRVVVLAGVVGAAVLGFAGYHFLLAGGSTDEVQPLSLPKPIVKPAAKAATAAKPAVKPATKLPAPTTVKLGRDPFLALYTVPVAAPAADAGGSASGSGSTSTDGSSSPTATSSPYALTLVSITGAVNEDKVFTFNVGGSKKTVVAAQKFGKYGELVTLNFIKNSRGTPVAALVQVGDDDPVVIRIGEKLTVL